MSKNPLPVRSPLDVLQLEFPDHLIMPQTIHDKLFYIAKARPGTAAQPVFAQAESVERLRAKLRKPVRPFTGAAEPTIPRVWDVLLGGKDNFEADREQGQKLIGVYPALAQLARESRQFQARAVSYVANRGIRQFIDIGCGLPTQPATHETAQAAQPSARVVYADNDEQVITHARGLLEKATGVLAVEGDLAFPDEITYDWRVRRFLDFFQPVCVVLTMTLHFFDADAARTIVRQLTRSVPYGSYLIVSAGQLEGEQAEEFTREYKPGRAHHHSRQDVAGFMDGLTLADPGITEAAQWRAPGFTPDGSRQGHIWAGVGWKEATL